MNDSQNSRDEARVLRAERREYMAMLSRAEGKIVTYQKRCERYRTRIAELDTLIAAKEGEQA